MGFPLLFVEFSVARPSAQGASLCPVPHLQVGTVICRYWPAPLNIPLPPPHMSSHCTCQCPWAMTSTLFHLRPPVELPYGKRSPWALGAWCLTPCARTSLIPCTEAHHSRHSVPHLPIPQDSYTRVVDAFVEVDVEELGPEEDADTHPGDTGRTDGSPHTTNADGLAEVSCAVAAAVEH